MNREETIRQIIVNARLFAEYGDDTDEWGWNYVEFFHQEFWTLLNELDGTEKPRRRAGEEVCDA